jgi:hypothetical protein
VNVTTRGGSRGGVGRAGGAAGDDRSQDKPDKARAVSS